jgi:hypothetical protein
MSRDHIIIRKSIPLMGRISRDAEKPSRMDFVLTGRIILEMWLFYGILSIL